MSKLATDLAFHRFCEELDNNHEVCPDAAQGTKLFTDNPEARYLIEGPGPECKYILGKHGLAEDHCIVIWEKSEEIQSAFHFPTHPFTLDEVLNACARTPVRELEQSLLEFVNLSLMCGMAGEDRSTEISTEPLLVLMMCKAGFEEDAANGDYSAFIKPRDFTK